MCPLFPGLQRLWTDHQSEKAPPVITVDNYERNAVHQFTYLRSTTSDNLTLDNEIDKRIGKAATTLFRLTKRVWEKNKKLTVKTKTAVYSACAVSALLCGSETRRTYARQERRLNSFHLRNLCCIVGISW